MGGRHTLRVLEVDLCGEKGSQRTCGDDSGLAETYLMPKNTAYSVVSGSRSLDWLMNVATSTSTA